MMANFDFREKMLHASDLACEQALFRSAAESSRGSLGSPLALSSRGKENLLTGDLRFSLERHENDPSKAIGDIFHIII